ncbi:DUF2029 domain-containing protein [Fibrisoma montanum]|uniref:DUF2029 domain-containing protein n=1 Tax=Fibrisoma montanum TaxID=2305895 RepID=A0A418MIS6_9BACT|nr:DUF2029 domain-containing protein [Fibrisoma montanum]RIV27319.1 DUF2029 domain-containing protein [Fibrisoma montanum]
MIKTPFPVNRLVAIGSAAAYCLLAYTVPRQNFGLLFMIMLALFLGYSSMVMPYRFTGAKKQQPDPFLFAAAIVFRLLLLFALPCLSDDVYRFIWDGRLLAHGHNPYLYLPRELLNTTMAREAGLNEALFGQLNSPDYFTVYPPLNQAMFGLAAYLAPASLPGAVMWLRIPILLSEIGSLWLMTQLLRRFRLNPNLALLYGLNPLVIIELTGNVHYEAVVIFFCLLAVWWLVSEKTTLSAIALSLAIATKLVPLLFIPLAIRVLGWRRGILYAVVVGLCTLSLFLPFASVELVRNIFSSINLYFQKFEFNASVYYVLRAIGYWIKGYNAIEFIGFWLSVVTALSILWISFRWRNVTPAVQILGIMSIYFALATTVHPWYATTLVAASVFTRFRYPLVWSALIPLSYATYQVTPYQENLWLTAVEYGIVVLVASLEIRLPRLVEPNEKATGVPTDGFHL